MYCDRRECSSGIRRRSTHLFSQRSPGDVGQDEQDSVSCRGRDRDNISHTFQTAHVSRALLPWQLHTKRQGEHKLHITADSPFFQAAKIEHRSYQRATSVAWKQVAGTGNAAAWIPKDGYRSSQSQKRLMNITVLFGW